MEGECVGAAAALYRLYLYIYIYNYIYNVYRTGHLNKSLVRTIRSNKSFEQVIRTSHVWSADSKESDKLTVFGYEQRRT